MTLSLRTASLTDSRFFYNLRTYEPYQQYFSSGTSIAFSDHERWFASRLQSPINLLYVASSILCDVGYVRFEPLSLFNGFEISFAIAPSQLRKGYSAPMISQSLHQFRSNISSPDSLCIIANVFDKNIPSIATLLKCGFSKLNQNNDLFPLDAVAVQSSKLNMHSYIILL